MMVLGDLSGIVFSLLIAVVSFLLSQFHPSFDALVVSIILGMLLSNILAKREMLQKGIDIMLRFFLPAGIALYATQLTFGNSINYWMWLSVIAVFIFSFLMTFLVARAFRLPESLAVLLASGFAVCGASAIAVISPLVNARKEDTSIATIAIMVMGLISMVFYPILWDVADMTTGEIAFFSGTTIPMLGQVKVAAGAAGLDVLSLAVRFKLVRISMLLFIAAGLLVFSRRWKSHNTETPMEITAEGVVSPGLHIPWFMIAFIVLALIVNLTDAFQPITRISEPISRFLLSSALAAIGLSVDLDSITSEGARPLLAVFLSWAIVVLFVYTGFRLLNV
ncbi:MAG: putative sulfate exporter family transporter [Thermodesulfovibrionales bacterium]